MSREIQADRIVFMGSLLASSRKPERRIDDYSQVVLDKLRWVLGHARSQQALPVFLGAFVQRSNDTQAWFLSRLIRVLRHHLNEGGLLPLVFPMSLPRTHEDDTSLDVLQSAGVIGMLPRFGVGTIVCHSQGARLALGCSGPQAQLPRQARQGLEDDRVDAVVWLSTGQWDFVEGETFRPIEGCALAIDAQEDLLSTVCTRQTDATLWLSLSPLVRTQPRARAITPWFLQGDVRQLAQGVAPVQMTVWGGTAVDEHVFDLSGLDAAASQGSQASTASLFAEELSGQMRGEDFVESEDALAADARLFLAQREAPSSAQVMFDSLFERAKAQRKAPIRPTDDASEKTVSGHEA